MTLPIRVSIILPSCQSNQKKKPATYPTVFTFRNCLTMTGTYLEQHLPPSVTQKLEAGAFRLLCDHLRERSDEVQNIDLMTISGFCRNCLAKVRTRENRDRMEHLRSCDLNRT